MEYAQILTLHAAPVGLSRAVPRRICLKIQHAAYDNQNAAKEMRKLFRRLILGFDDRCGRLVGTCARAGSV